MSLKDCIQRAHDQGVLTVDEKQRLMKRYDDLVASVPTTREAKEILIQELETQAQEKERVALIADRVRRDLERHLYSFRNRHGEQDLARAFLEKVADLEYLRESVIGRSQANIDGLLAEFKRGGLTGDKRRQAGWFGNKTVKLRLDNVVKELFGETSSDPLAKAIAVAWEKVSDSLRQEFNGAGGNIAKLDKWGLPQWHNAEALLNFGRQAWVDHMMKPDILDRKRMLDHTTGLMLSDAELREGLGVMWDRVTTHGMIDQEVTSVPTGNGALYKQHQDHRWLHFASGDAWMTYAQEFGNPDPYTAMMGHIATMARDISAMKTFGPNPAAMMNYTKKLIDTHYATGRSSNAVLREQRADVAKLSAVVAGEQSAIRNAMLAEMDKIHAVLNDLRDRGGRYGEPGKESGLMTDALMALDKLHRRFEDDYAKLVEAAPGVIAARERLAEIMDDLREETALPTGDWQNKTRKNIAMATEMWDIYRGAASAPVDSKLANSFRTARNFMVAAKLGSAIASAMTDSGFQKATRSIAGMDRNGVTQIIMDMTKMFSAQTRQEMVRSRLILDNAMHGVQQQARYAGSVNTMEISGYLADRVIALQGLSAWTQWGKWAFGMEFFGAIADVRHLPFAELNPNLQRTMQKADISPQEWEIIRSAPVYRSDARAAGMLRSNDVEAVGGRALADKYQMMMLRLRRRAVPEPTLEARAMMMMGTRPGTWSGEITRSGLQFKSFGVTVALLHGGTTMDELARGGYRSAAGYAIPLALTTMLLGALALQLKEMIGGRDPRDVTDPKFWGAAFLQGGGMGIMGDFLNVGLNGESRAGGGLASTVAGPLVGEVSRVMNATLGNTSEAIRGEKTNIGRELVGLARSNTPFATFAPTRLATDRLFFDKLQLMLDPNAKRSFDNRVRNRKKDYGNEFFWSPGDASPRRGPAVESLIGRR